MKESKFGKSLKVGKETNCINKRHDREKNAKEKMVKDYTEAAKSFEDDMKKYSTDPDLFFININPKEKTYEEDCYFFSREQDMGAHSPCCNKKDLDHCYEPEDCDRTKCKFYISRLRVSKIVHEIVGD